ncbi:proteolipid protein DM beta-like [Saccoglossus kowalevskii]|uniref:Neuronal membrane glycoprotein M6-b-like n=1 Tax=Saccoglossus kowalevskii TaxID=10224 RepID=A0ABM0GU83_SACKO|nr:PREDICTED: neuronal membrane glycoprotein M6-b-like [Saccoglossus kowalevskii]
MSKCECWNSKCCRFMERVPYATAASAIIIIIGVSVFCVYALRAEDGTQQLFNDNGVDENDNYKASLEYLSKCAYGVTGGTAGMAVILVVIGVLTTDGTRLQLCSRYRVRMCGRVALIFFFLIYYALTIVWFILACGIVVPVLFSSMLRVYCGNDYETVFNNTTSCLDLAQYGLGKADNGTLCNERLIQFCKEGIDIWEDYTLSWGGAALVVVGLIHALICLAANYSHVKDTTKSVSREYEQVHDRTPDGVELKDYPS